jgi:hypothetical protein
VHRHAWAGARAGAVRHTTWFRPAPGIGHCPAGDYRQDIPGCLNVDLRDLNYKEFRRIADRARSPPQPNIQIVVPQQRIGFAPGMPAITRPAVLPRRLHHARRHRIQFYVAHTGKEILIRLHSAPLVAPFPVLDSEHDRVFETNPPAEGLLR